MSFWIVTDACCDFPPSYASEQAEFTVMPMSYQIDGEVKEINPLDESLTQSMHAFYEKLLAGSVATTFQVNQQSWLETITALCEKGHDVLVLAFSSGLSGTCASAMAAVKEVNECFPTRKVLAVDTLCASMGEGLLVRLVLKQRERGKTLEECYEYALAISPRVNHWVVVDDLHFLRRGGRVSASSAYLGSILKIKPVINVDPRGKLIPREKVQGRKRSLRALFEKAQAFALEPEKQTMFISHADCEQDALWLAGKLKTDLHVPEVGISMIGPIVGSHSGPGTVALFFLDKAGEGRLGAGEA